MFSSKKPQKSVDDFWREYEDQTGEKVLARTLGQYISGWEEFDAASLSPLWGLVIVTSGGFRFHHFPQQNWVHALIRSLPTDKEKTFFVPGERIVSAFIHKETNWWKKLTGPNLPLLKIKYRHEEDGTALMEKELVLQIDYKTDGLAENLNSFAGSTL